MKRILFYILFLTFCIISGLSIHKAILKGNNKISDITLSNVEALANSEHSGEFKWCKTGTITDYGMWVLHCGNCDMQMVSYATGEGYCYQK